MKDIHPYDLHVLISVFPSDKIIKDDIPSLEIFPTYTIERTVWNIAGEDFRVTTSAKHHMVA